ncbi:MAG TPA: hypothetical protein VJ044_08035, partial [Candidatus Hodarchaeales archaeon]|nr:hypothetical protein [Candidatus Hodarchaeales archaeon]
MAQTNPDFLLLIPLAGPIILALVVLLLDRSFKYSKFRTPKYIFSIVPVGLSLVLLTLIYFLNEILISDVIYTYEVHPVGPITNSFSLNPFNGTMLVL